MTKKEWLIVAILTFITVCSWVVFNILHARAEVEISPKLQEATTPLNPDFDTSVVE